MMKLISGLLTYTFVTHCYAYQDFSPKIKMRLTSLRVSELCFEQGYVRARDERLAQIEHIPAISVEELLISDQRTFHRYRFIAPTGEYYNPLSKQVETYNIKECSEFILNPYNKETILQRKASPAEAVFYSNLLNHNISNSYFESWSNAKEGLTDYIESELEEAKIELISTRTEMDYPLEFGQYEVWKSQFERVIGGEQSGGGSGKVLINLKMSADDLKRIRKGNSKLEDIFGLKSIYQKVVNDEIKLPKSKIYVTKEGL